MTLESDRNAIIRHYEDSRRELMSAIDGLCDAQMLDPSLDGWSVKDHLAHVAYWDELRRLEVERIAAGYESALTGVTPQHVQTLNDTMSGLRRAWTLEQARWELDSSRQRFLDAIRSAGVRGLDESHYRGAALSRSQHESEHADQIRRWRAERGI